MDVIAGRFRPANNLLSSMKNTRTIQLHNAPLQYAPENELGVVFLFSQVAKKLQFRVEQIRPQYPDCIVYRRIGNREKRVRIEFEYKSSNFRSHKHDPKECDCIVCWHHDWPGAPKHLEIIELKRHFGVGVKIWIQPAVKSQWFHLDGADKLNWALSKRSTPGDLLLMYRCVPEKSISEIFRFTGELGVGEAEWRNGKCYFGCIERICNLDSPIFLDDLRNHKVLRTSFFVRRNMQGNLLVSEYWPYLYDMIISRNPKSKKLLSKYAPEMI